MPLDPQTKAFVEAMRDPNPQPIASFTPQELREAFMGLFPEQEKLAPVASVTDVSIDGPGGDLAIRIYAPEVEPPYPALVYLHGGGFVIGDIDSSMGLCRSFASSVGCAVVAVDYRLAPESKFPAASLDAYAALKWVASSGDRYGLKPDRLAIAGDSAGGNLAASAALRARDERMPELLLQVLIYPMIDHNFDTASYRENADDYLLTREALEWYWAQYLPDDSMADDPYCCPIRSRDLSGVAPGLILTAGYDPLRDEAEDYGRKLKEAGVESKVVRYGGTVHGFLAYPEQLDVAREANQLVVDSLREALLGG